MTLTKWIVVIGFLVAFSAGAVTGLQVRRPPAPPPPPREDRWLMRELNLTPQQNEQIRKVWSDAMRSGGRDHDNRRQTLRQERDEAIAKLIRPEDRAEYDRIVQRFAATNQQLADERAKAVEAAVEKTKQLLTDSQRQKYEEILKKREADWRGRPGRRVDTRPATQPASPNTKEQR